MVLHVNVNHVTKVSNLMLLVFISLVVLPSKSAVEKEDKIDPNISHYSKEAYNPVLHC